ncbi:ATM interactor [Lissotriton helveticus]
MAAACVSTAKRTSKSGSPRVRADFSCEHWEIVKPSVSDLTREGRSNILCTVQGCGKVLSNPPALNMHLVKSHGVQEGLINPTVRKVLKPHSQRLYCCPIEGCPRGPNRPFSQFSLVKQHFMKMHAEKKHKCEKCDNSYSTEGDLKRHASCCGKTFQCTCGCPYASRTALLSHIYRTGHEIPAEHRDPPVRKRKMEELVQSYKTSDKQSEFFNQKVLHCDVAQKFDSSAFKPLVTFSDLDSPCIIEQALGQSKRTPKFLLPKPNIGLVQLPVMQFALFPTVPSADCSLASPVHLVSRSVNSSPNAKIFVLKGAMPFSKIAPSSSETIIGTAQTDIGSTLSRSVVQGLGHNRSKVRFASSNAQTDLSCISQVLVPTGSWNFSESSCSQTDLSFGAPVFLPVSVEVQTLGSDSKGISSMATQTGPFGCDSFSPSSITRETQTSEPVNSAENREQMDQAVMCNDLFNIVSSSYTVSTQTSLSEETLSAETVDQRFLQSNMFRDVSSGTVKSETNLSENRLIGINMDHTFLETSEIRELGSHNVKSEPFINFTEQRDVLPQQNMTDSQTQTMDLLSDLENILSGNLSNQTLDNRSLLSDANAGGEMHLSSGSAPHAGIDFDIEEFFSASNIQTQTDESDLGNINAESLDIETQTDFFSSGSTLRGNANFLAMFDTQTQTDLNFFLDHSTPLPIGNILKEASFSVSTDSSDNETQTDMISGKLAPTLSLENQVQLNSAETQTIDSCLDTLGSLFLTSNETQTAMDDFLLADLAWNTMESQFSSVETQTCKELLSLFHTSDNLGD